MSSSPIAPARVYGAMPSPPATLDPSQLRPSMNPPDLTQYAQHAKWASAQVYYPEILIPCDPGIGIFLRRRVVTNTFTAASETYSENLQFDLPTTVIAISAAVLETTGGALAAGQQVFYQDRNVFTLELIRTTGDRLDTTSGLGGALTGTGALPALIGAGGWMFNNGSSLRTTLVSQRANIRVDVAFWTVEFRGPAGFSWPTA